LSDVARCSGALRQEVDMRAVPLATVLAFLCALPLASRADDPVERAKACSAKASERRLTGEQQKAYLKSCIASEGPLPDPLDTQKAVDKRCNAEANLKALTGTDRSAFVSACRRRG
jgi:hypothetical protein